MVDLKTHGSEHVLIGDIVGSRAAADRRAVHDAVVAALADTDARVPSLRGLAVTFSDEFQGAYTRLGDALEAAWRVRLTLLPDVDVRIGLGRGAATVVDADRGIEDGPAWWAARAAVEAVEEQAGRSPTRWLRTAVAVDGVEGAPVPEGGDLAAVNAALLCRDHLVGSLSDRSLRLLRGLMEDDVTQAELADREGISASAVSQRVRTDGIGAVLAAQSLLRGLA